MYFFIAITSSYLSIATLISFLSAHIDCEDLFCEIMCRTIAYVVLLSKRWGRKIPQHLVIVCDNTVAWGKNQIGLRFLAWLVMHGHFATATMMSLMSGHTHEDIEFWQCSKNIFCQSSHYRCFCMHSTKILNR